MAQEIFIRPQVGTSPVFRNNSDLLSIYESIPVDVGVNKGNAIKLNKRIRSRINIFKRFNEYLALDLPGVFIFYGYVSVCILSAVMALMWR